MRILHVVTLLSPAGEYGGPTRVALDQAAELQARGHNVAVAGASRGFPTQPRAYEGVPVFLWPGVFAVPRLGFSGLISPGLVRASGQLIRGADLVHVHLARDLITLPMALRALHLRVPLVLQTHGMIDRSNHPLAPPLDALATRRALTGASLVLALTELEERALREVAGSDLLRVRRLVNGVPPLRGSDAVAREERLIVFAARLHPVKRPEAFVEMASLLERQGLGARYVIAGPDEGLLESVTALVDRRGLSDKVTMLGALEASDMKSLLGRASVLVLPSLTEVFPVTVLEAMSLGTPVVVTTANGLADAVTECGCGLVSGLTPQELADAVAGVVCEPVRAAMMGERGVRAVAETYSINKVVDQLESYYRDVRS